MSTVVFIESNTTGSGKLLLEKAIAQGFSPIFITANPQKYRFLGELLVSPTVLDTANADEIAAFLSTVANIQAILSSSEYFVGIAAQLAQQFGLKGNNPAAIACCRDKNQLAETLSAAHIRYPRTAAVSSLSEIEETLAQFNTPFVIKPRSGSGSCLVKLCATAQLGKQHIQTILSAGRTALVQDYILGTEYSVETLTNEGRTTLIGITRKHLGEAPHFVEIGHDFPAALTIDEQATIQSTVEVALSAVGFTFGAAHTELRFSSAAGATIIEINPRLAGGMIPALIQSAYGIDLLDIVLAMHLGETFSFEPRQIKQNKHAAIRFLLPAKTLILERVEGIKTLSQQAGVVDYQQIKQSGDRVGDNHDFSDRVAYLITTANTHQQAKDYADRALSTLSAVGQAIEPSDTDQAKTGRLKSTLSPDIRALVFPPLDSAKLTEALTQIITLDEAHLVMLTEQGIIPSATAAALLQQISALKINHDVLLNREAPRGLYLLYESVLADRAGPDIAGVLQTGRSRNDMNATIFKLSVRAGWTQIFQGLWELRNSLLSRMSVETETVFPIYSQYQTALPGSLSHYLLAIEASLSRCGQELVSLLSSINQCPLGAGGGGGTSWRIDQFRLASLLGFSTLHINSLDAVASRELGIRYLCALNNLCIMLSRVAQDIQLWTTQEFNLIELPDSLSGGSSMMPQKKNPYLLEWIKAKASVPMGALTALNMTLAKTPFSNSYEVSAKAQASLAEPTEACLGSMKILQSIVSQMTVNQHNSDRRVMEGLAFSTSVADECVRSKDMSFRSAHHAVGEIIRQAIDHQQSPLAALKETFPEAMKDSPLAWVNAVEYGGGPGQSSVEAAIARTRQRLSIDASLFRSTTERWNAANQSRLRAVHSLLETDITH